jgi:adenosylcobinamide kinase / adenosylcobinamide-phosphate guanylyltransferase
MGRIILIGGGARSGKSRFALALARRLGRRRAFVATAQPLDAEMSARIAEHARQRGDDFETVEEPVDLPAALARATASDVVVVDCLTIWLANLLVRGDTASYALETVGRLIVHLERRERHFVLVSNEVGLGLVPETPLGRAFRDVTGLAHQRIARVADEIYLAVLGTILRLRPGPVAVAADDEMP